MNFDKFVSTCIVMAGAIVTIWSINVAREEDRELRPDEMAGVIVTTLSLGWAVKIVVKL
jgi:hypothetical protein